MRKILAIAVLAAVSFIGRAQTNQNPRLQVHTINYSGSPIGVINFWQYTPPNYNNTDLFPLIISLHGVGQAGENISEINGALGDGLPLKVSSGTGAGHDLVFSYTNHNVTTTAGFVMLVPQSNRSDVNSWPPYYVDQMIEYGINNLRVDPARIFLTGFSAGGGGVWKYATSTEAFNNPHKLAGIAPVSSSNLGTNFCNIGSQKIAVWTFHGGDDDLIPQHTDNEKAAAVNACNPPPIIPAVDTVVGNESHGIYQSVVYDYTNSHHYPNVFQWMLRVNRNLDHLTNQPPVPIITAGSSLSLTTPVKVTDMQVLDGSGSYDNDDIIMDYLWSNTAAPAGTNISVGSNIWPQASVSNGAGVFRIPVGTYNFQLRVKDYLTSAIYNGNNHTQFANITINVSYPASGFSAPATDAGGSITIPTTQTQVTGRSGNASPYPCSQCGIAGYNWSQVSGPPASLGTFSNPSQPYVSGDNNVSFTNLNSPGVYQFRFSATNQHGDVGSDIFTITKLGALPVKYSYFKGQNTGSSNVLTWATTAELNSERFDIQRSTDGSNFATIGTVASRGGDVLTTYSFTDANPPAGQAYYRLSQVDKDGHTELSQTIVITAHKPGLYIEKYPNPAHNNLFVTLQSNTNGPVEVMVADMQGKVLLRQQWQKEVQLLKKTINTGSLQNGVYQLIVISGQDKQISSFVKQ